MSKTAGYIIEDETKSMYWMDEKGILYHANGRVGVTLFKTRERARTAIRRTGAYAKCEGLEKDWECDYVILRVIHA